MKRATWALLFFFALSAAGITQITPSYADGSCNSGYACIYKHANLVGFMVGRKGGQGRVNLSAKDNDQMTSWHNATSWNGAWYWDMQGHPTTGRCVTMKKNEVNLNVGAFDNDKMSAWRTDRGC